MNPVEAHHTGDGFRGGGERAAEAAAFIGTMQLDEFETLDQTEQWSGLAEWFCHPLRRTAEPEFAQPVTTVVQADGVGECDLQMVKLAESECGMRPLP